MYTTSHNFGIDRRLRKKSLMLAKDLFDQKYSKMSNIIRIIQFSKQSF